MTNHHNSFSVKIIELKLKIFDIRHEEQVCAVKEDDPIHGKKG